MNRTVSVVMLLCCGVVGSALATSIDVKRGVRYAKHFEGYLTTKLKQTLPLRLRDKGQIKTILNELLAGESYIVSSGLYRIDQFHGGYEEFRMESSSRLFPLRNWKQQPFIYDGNLNNLKKTIYDRLTEKFVDPKLSAEDQLRYTKLDGDVIMIRDGKWEQYPFSFDGYADEKITIADQIINNPADTFRLQTERQPFRSFGSNLELRLGRPQHKYLVASGHEWLTLAEKFGEQQVMDWYSNVASPTVEQVEWIVDYLYSRASGQVMGDYQTRQLLRHWQTSAGLGEPQDSLTDRQLVEDLAKHRDMILDGEYGYQSSRELIKNTLELTRMSLGDLKPESLGYRPSKLNFITYDLISRHFKGELVVNQQTMKNFLQAFQEQARYHRANDEGHLIVWRIEDTAIKTVVFEELLQRYQLATEDNRSAIDQSLREVLERYISEGQ